VMSWLSITVPLFGRGVPLAGVLWTAILLLGTVLAGILRKKRPRLILVFVLVDIFSAAAVCQWTMYRVGMEYKNYHPYDRKSPGYLLDQVFMIPQPNTLRVLSCGNAPVVADLLWIRGMQYYAQHYSQLTRPPAKGEGLVNLLLAIKTLDPFFIPVYKWGALALSDKMNDPVDGYWTFSEWRRDGSRSLIWTGDPKTGTRGAEVGIREFLLPGAMIVPGMDWVTYVMEAGFTAWWYLDNRDLAGKILLMGASRAGNLAAVLLPRQEIPEWVFTKDYKNAAIVKEFLNKLAIMETQGDNPANLQQAVNVFVNRLSDAVKRGDETNQTIAIRHLSEVFSRMMRLKLEDSERIYLHRYLMVPASIEDLAGNVPEPSESLRPYIQNLVLALKTALNIDLGDRIELPWPPEKPFTYVPEGGGLALRSELEEKEGRQVRGLNFLLKKYWEEKGRAPDNLESLAPEYLQALPQNPFGNIYRVDQFSQPPVVTIETSTEAPTDEKRRELAVVRLQSLLKIAEKQPRWNAKEIQDDLDRCQAAVQQDRN